MMNLRFNVLALLIGLSLLSADAKNKPVFQDLPNPDKKTERAHQTLAALASEADIAPKVAVVQTSAAVILPGPTNKLVTFRWQYDLRQSQAFEFQQSTNRAKTWTPYAVSNVTTVTVPVLQVFKLPHLFRVRALGWMGYWSDWSEKYPAPEVPRVEVVISWNPKWTNVIVRAASSLRQPQPWPVYTNAPNGVTNCVVPNVGVRFFSGNVPLFIR